MKRQRKTRVMEILAGSLTFDDRYQRDLVPARVKKLAEKLDLDAIGIVTVSRRKVRGKEVFVVVDGQHRIAALLHHGFGEWKVKCNVYDDLDPEDEAALFRELNDTRRITAYDDFRAGLVEGDAECLAIVKICRAAGLDVQKQATDGGITCVAALRDIYRRDNGRPGGETLANVLGTAISAWGITAAAVEGKVLQGLGIVESTRGDQIDRPALIKKLSKIGGHASGLVGLAKGLREHRGGSIPRCIASITVDLYNKGRRVGALDPL